MFISSYMKKCCQYNRGLTVVCWVFIARLQAWEWYSLHTTLPSCDPSANTTFHENLVIPFHENLTGAYISQLPCCNKTSLNHNHCAQSAFFLIPLAVMVFMMLMMHLEWTEAAQNRHAHMPTATHSMLHHDPFRKFFVPLLLSKPADIYIACTGSNLTTFMPNT